MRVLFFCCLLAANGPLLNIRLKCARRHLKSVFTPSGLFGPYKNWRRGLHPQFDGQVYRAEYDSLESVALAHHFSMSGTTIVCPHPNGLLQNTLIQNIEPGAPITQRLVPAGTALGSTAFVAEVIEAEEKLDQEPVGLSDKVSLLGHNSAEDVTNKILGLVRTLDALTDQQEESLLNMIHTAQIDWDKSTRRALKHYGYKFHTGGSNIAPADPIPESPAEAHHLAAESLLRHGIPYELNQCTVARYEPGVGVGSHTESPALGKVVVMLGLQGSVPMEFTPVQGGPKTAVDHRRCSILAMTGKSLQRY